MSAELTEGGHDRQREPTLYADCHSCPDVHPVGDRPRKRGTTACPACGALGYTTISRTAGVEKSEADRIADAVRDVDGVGDDTLANIVDAFAHYHAFQAASRRELEQIEGVGRMIATEIAEGR